MNALELLEQDHRQVVRVLGEMVKQHVKEEEEELFPEVESAEMDLDALGKELGERKDELMSKMAE
ncbi:MAG: hypothetical protein JOZ11_10495 [Alphaproteobacteria bacterium]|nr:hypothetical protein [Alphaproteobacteria bacterium]